MVGVAVGVGDSVRYGLTTAPPPSLPLATLHLHSSCDEGDCSYIVDVIVPLESSPHPHLPTKTGPPARHLPSQPPTRRSQCFRSGRPLHQRFVYQILLGIKRQWTWHAPRYKGQRAQTVIDLPEPPEGSRMVSAAVEEWGVGTGWRGEGEGSRGGGARRCTASSVGGAVRGMGFGRS